MKPNTKAKNFSFEPLVFDKLIATIISMTIRAAFYMSRACLPMRPD